MHKSGKVWGWTYPIFNILGVEIDRIHVTKGGYCSVHKHEYRFNAFFVFNGSLEIDTWKNDYDLCDKTILEKDQFTIVKPGEYHRFFAQSDVDALEIYWTNPASSSDIIRQLSGGITNLVPPDWDKNALRESNKDK